MPRRYAVLIAAAAVGALAACESTPPRQTAPTRPANVQSAGSVDHQQREIEARIEQAYRSGRLSADDYRTLKTTSDDIRREERRYMADSDLSANEKQALSTRLDSLSREVDRRSR